MGPRYLGTHWRAACKLEFFPLEGLFPAPLGWGTGPDCCLAYLLKGSPEYPAFLESQGGVLKGAPAGNFVILLEDFNTHVGNDHETWKGVTGRNGMPDLI